MKRFVLAALILAIGIARPCPARNSLIWELKIQRDSLVVTQNMFTRRGFTFPVSWLEVERDTSYVSVSREGTPDLVVGNEVALIHVSRLGDLLTDRIRFYPGSRLCDNAPVFLVPKNEEQGSPFAAGAGVPTVTLDMPTTIPGGVLRWYEGPDTNRIVLCGADRTVLFDRAGGRISRTDFVRTTDLQSAPERNVFVAVQREEGASGGRKSSRAFRSRIALMSWSGDLLWAGPWARAELAGIHIFPDGATIHYSIVSNGSSKLFCKSAGDSIPRELSGLPAGPRDYSADGSHMLVRLDAAGQNIAVYNTADPCAPVKIAERGWWPRTVGEVAVSASGASYAVTLRKTDATGTHGSLVMMNRGGMDVSDEPLSVLDPPISFLGEFLVIGLRDGRTAVDTRGRNPGFVQMFMCE